MNKDIGSPEERLLRLIRGEKKQKSLKEKSLSADRQDKISLPKKLIPRITAFQTPKIKRLLQVLLILSFSYLLISFIWPIFFPKEIKSSLVVRKEIKAEEVKPKPYSLYQEQITKQIFGPSAQIAKSTEGLPVSVGVEAIKDLNLLGIISGENPQAIIEDKKTHKTYFLKQGEFLGEFQVESIGEGKVTLNFHEQKFDLFL